ncbi:MAG: type II toxin-antitoxin system VapC family toxin [Chloroflexota bacterium]
MRYLLDTNICIQYLNQRSQAIIDRFEALEPEDVVVCSVVKAELFFGAVKSHDPQGTFAQQQEFLGIFASLPFDDDAAIIYAHIRANLATLGTPIGPNDLMIAAIALANNLILVTHNTREFSRISALNLEDWEET